MKLNGDFITILFALIIAMTFSCQKGKEHTTDSGFKYRLYTEMTGHKPQLGDYVSIELVYKTNKDSILFDSRKNNVPLRFRLDKIPFKGSYEEGLTYLSEGDSATFFVPADSLYTFFVKSQADQIAQSATIFSAGAYFKFDIKLIKIQDYVNAEQDQLTKLSFAEKEEQKAIRNYIYGKDFTNSPDSGEYYIKRIKKGNGDLVLKGKFVSLKYTGKFLDGRIFDHSSDVGSPFVFRVGDQRVVKGWEDAILTLKKGDRVELLVPSKNAFGVDGLLNSKEGSYSIPPFTPLLYDLEVLQLQDTLRLVKSM